MKDWLVCRLDGGGYWLTRVETLDSGYEYLCGYCDAPLDDSVVAIFESSRGAPGYVVSSICRKCDAIAVMGEEISSPQLHAQIERVLSEAQQ